MSDQEHRDPLFDSWLRSLKDRPIVAVLLVMVAIVSGIASFTDSIDKLSSYFRSESDQPQSATKSDADLHFEQALVGTWELTAEPPAPSGFTVIAFTFTFQPNGVVNWGGFYKVEEQVFPIMLSGLWHVEDGFLHYRVESSNVPLVAKEGYSSSSRIISVTENDLIYIDSFDGKKRTATRRE